MAYNTGNPVGSTDPRDLFDNAGNLDWFANGANPFYPDRFGVMRLSLSGMRYNFNQAQEGRAAQFTATQEGMNQQFQAFLLASGYEAPVAYAEGTLLQRSTQTFVRDGVQYRIKDPGDLPYTLTGNWASEEGNFVSIGDGALRQELADAIDLSKGASQVGRSVVMLASVKDLLDSPRLSTHIYELAAYHPGAFALASPSGIGGGRFVWAPLVLRSGHDGGAIISPTVPWDGTPSGLENFVSGVGETEPAASGAFIRLHGDSLGVRDFGAIAGDDTFDNRASFQAAIEACEARGTVFDINPTADTEFYHLKSFNPDESAGKHCLIIRNVRNFHAIGHRKRNTNVVYSGESEGKSLLCLLSPVHDWGIKLVDLGLSAGSKLDHALLGTNTFYALSVIQGGTYAYAKLDGIRVSIYMSELNNIHSAANGRDCFNFCGPDDQGGANSSTTTSITVTSCWARLSGRFGFNCENAMWYSNLISCGVDGGSVTGAADRFQCAYRFYAVHGVSIDGCGAEKVDQYARIDTFVSGEINNPKGTDIGPTTGMAQAMIFLGGGNDFSVRGLPNGMWRSDRFSYAIATNANTGNERIEVSGGYIERANCYFTPSTAFKNWPDVFYFPGWGGSKADRGKPVLGCQMYSGPVVIGPRPTERTYVNKKVADLVSSATTSQSVDLLEVSGPLTGPTLIKVELTIAKYAGSPNPAVGSASFAGSAMIASGTKSGGAMAKVSGEAYTANLTWVGDKLTVDIPAQYVVALISVEFWSRSAFCKFL